MALLPSRTKEIDERRSSKKLNLSAPLMSVRRHHQVDTATTTATTSSDDEEQQQQQQQQQQQHGKVQLKQLSSDDGEPCEETRNNWESLRSPGAVPFVWERTPGRPKKDDPQQQQQHWYQPPVLLPPGRMGSPSRPPAVADPSMLDSFKVLPQQQQRRKKKVASALPSFFKFKKMQPPEQEFAAEGYHEQQPQEQAQKQQQADDIGKDEDDDEAFSDAQETENNTEDPAPASRRFKVADTNPAARDFIMRRFLPAAKAMADESSSASPLRNAAPPRHASPAPAPIRVHEKSAGSKQPVSASVERIQRCQYKFSSSDSVKFGGSADNSDFFTTKACGFFSFGLLKRRFPSSRLRRLSDPANNRFASDGFQARARSEDGSSASEDEDDYRYQPKITPGPRVHRPPNASPDVFYDCESNFNRGKLLFSPQKVRTPDRLYYRGPSTCPAAANKGFLGLPEDYKPPEDPYRNSGLSPSLKWKSSSEAEKKSYHNLAPRPSATVQRNAVPVAVPPQRIASPKSSYGTPEHSAAGWKSSATRNDGNCRSDSPVAIRGFGSCNEVTQMSTASEPDVRGWRQQQTLRAAMLRSDLESAAQGLSSPTRNNDKLRPVLLPPKSPSQPWLHKATLPQVTSNQSSTKWEATVKSRQIRTGHLRYSEENALQPCEGRVL